MRLHEKRRDYACHKGNISDMLQNFGILACKPLQLPMDANAKFNVDEGEKVKDEHLYRSVIGSLIYVTIRRSDIVHVVGVLSPFMQEPIVLHLNATRRILRYLKGTINYGILYDYNDDLSPRWYYDVDWASSLHDRRSVSRYVFMIGSKTIS